MWDIFFLRVKKILRLQSHAIFGNQRFAHKSLQNPDFEAIYLFSVYSCHTTVVRRKICSLTIQLHHVKISAKSNKTRINFFFCQLASLLYATDEATVAHSNGKTQR